MGEAEAELEAIEKIRKQRGQYCSWSEAYRIFKGMPPGAPGNDFDRKELIKDIISAVKEEKSGAAGKMAESVDNLKEKIILEHEQGIKRAQEESERRKKEVDDKAQEKAAELIEELKEKLKGDSKDDGLPKDPLTRVAYEAMLGNMKDVLSGKGGKGFQFDHDTISALGDIMSNMTGQVTRTVESVSQRGKSKDFIMNMGWIIQTLKGAGFEKELTLGKVIELMTLAQGATTTPPEGITAVKTKRQLQEEMERDIEKNLGSSRNENKEPEKEPENNDNPDFDKVK
jgi:hypothetical protein